MPAQCLGLFHVKHSLGVRLGLRIPLPVSRSPPALRARPRGRPWRVARSLRDHYGRRRIQIVPATSHHPDRPGTERCHHTPMLRYFFVGAIPLDCQQAPALTKQRHAPSSQFVERCHGSAQHRVKLIDPLPHSRILPAGGRAVAVQILSPRLHESCQAGRNVDHPRRSKSGPPCLSIWVGMPGRRSRSGLRPGGRESSV